jgi:hypothetical protein
MSRTRSLLGAAALVAGSVIAATGTPASAAPVWNPNGTIRPGVQTVTGGQQCTANFVFYDSSNNVYIGQSAHCASLSGPTVTNGCQANSMPLNTNVTVGGATRPGKMVYSSWIAMKAANPAPTATECASNDFAIVKLDPADYGRVNPTVPFWGGPNALNTTGAPLATEAYSYGNSGLRFGISTLSPKQGVTSNSTNATSWSIRVYTATPGIPGDSGSAFLDRSGNALGTLSSLYADGSNGVASLRLQLDYLRAHSAYTTLELATGLTPFAKRLV